MLNIANCCFCFIPNKAFGHPQQLVSMTCIGLRQIKLKSNFHGLTAKRDRPEIFKIELKI